MDWRAALAQARRNPRNALRVALALARGAYYWVRFRLLGQRVVIGFGFRVVGRLDIRGPRTVIFGGNRRIR